MEKIGSWIPQVFYDLIGRIIPGCLLLIIACLIFPEPSTLRELFSATTLTTTSGSTTSVSTFDISTSVLFFAGFVASYMLGALLGGIAEVTNPDVWKRNKAQLTTKRENDTSYVYDYIQFQRPDIGARIAKLSAERHMCRVVLVGSIILIIGYPIASPLTFSDTLFWVIECGLGLMGFSALCLYRHLSYRSYESMRNNWRLIHEEQKAS
jgi:hypothetical protein